MSDLTQAGLLHDLAQRLERARAEFEDTTVKCGITGISGSGKSSLINAIAGQKIARVNVVEETTEPLEHRHGGVRFVDLPGCGTNRWPRETYVERLSLASYDCLILVTAHRFYEADAYLYHEIAQRLRKPCFVVRNKFDQAVEEGERDNDLTEEQVRALIEKNVRDNLAPEAPTRVYLTSARHPDKYDLPLLIRDIVNSQEGSKRTRLIADVAAWSEEMFQEKRKVAEHLIGVYAGLSAANALNPIPGLDVSVDLGLLHKMSRALLHMYGLTETQSSYTLKFLDKNSSSARALKQLATRIASQYATEQAIAMLLKSFGKSAAAREISKWVPFVGTLVSAGIGFRLTYRFGEQLVGDCESAARDFLKTFQA
jgi:predicted GTPase